MSEAVQELKRSADDSERGLKETAQSLRVSQRPYLTMENTKFDPALDQKHSPAVMLIDFFNSGRSPALKEELEAHAWLGNVPISSVPSKYPGESIIAAERSVTTAINITIGDAAYNPQ